MALPLNPIDGQVAIDSVGVLYRYEVDVRSWVRYGTISEGSVVNVNDNGLITPSIANLLNILSRSLIQDFKLSPNEDAYYYLFKTNHRLFRFKVEGNDLRIELATGPLTNVLWQNACQGPKGLKGEPGEDGINGTRGPSEKFLIVTTDDNFLSFVAPVPTILPTEISIRLFYNNNETIEIWLDPNTNDWEIIKDSGININESESTIRYINGSVDINLSQVGSWGDGWKAKARQRGPKGLNGIDGSPFIGIDETFALRASNSAIWSLRWIRNRDLTKITKRMDLDFLPVAHLRPWAAQNPGDHCVVQGNASISTLLDKYLAVEPTIDYNKVLWRWIYNRELPHVDDLLLPIWVPDPSCLKPNRENWKPDSVPFEWYNKVKDAPEFRTAGELDGKCCQEDFFFYPGVGPCEITQNPGKT